MRAIATSRCSLNMTSDRPFQGCCALHSSSFLPLPSAAYVRKSHFVCVGCCPVRRFFVDGRRTPHPVLRRLFDTTLWPVERTSKGMLNGKYQGYAISHSIARRGRRQPTAHRCSAASCVQHTMHALFSSVPSLFLLLCLACSSGVPCACPAFGTVLSQHRLSIELRSVDTLQRAAAAARQAAAAATAHREHRSGVCSHASAFACAPMRARRCVRSVRCRRSLTVALQRRALLSFNAARAPRPVARECV
jgi:hypothetical protein